MDVAPACNIIKVRGWIALSRPVKYISEEYLSYFLIRFPRESFNFTPNSNLVSNTSFTYQ